MDEVFVKLIVAKGVDNVDLSMLPNKEEVYSKAAQILFDEQKIVEAVKCWKLSGSEMPKEELIKIANNEMALGNKEVAFFIFKSVDAQMASFIEKNYSNNL